MLKQNKFLFFSVFAHLVVIYVVAQSVMFPSVPDTLEKKPNVIQATLIFDLPSTPAKTPIQEVKEEVPLPTEPEEEPPVVAPPLDSLLEPEVTPISQPPQALTSKPEDVAQEQPKPKDKMIEVTPTPNSEIRAPATNMARRHLSSFQQQKQNRMAEQASRYYQQRKNSPTIDDEVKNPFMTEDEKLRDSLKVRADCTSATQKTTAVLLGFLGGQIDCSKPPPIDDFIQNRINKESHLPGQYQLEDKKRPQSVVIKKRP